MTDDDLRAADSLVSRDGRPTLRIERCYPHPIDKVWQAITTPENLARWFPSPVEVDLRPGGALRFGLGGGEGGDQATSGEVIEVDPPRRFAFSWEDDRLQFDLTAEGGGTRLVMLHTFDDEPGAASFASGWDRCLAALAPLLAGEPVPTPGEVRAAVASPAGVARHEELAARFGLDRGTITEAGGWWTIRFERQLTCPAEVAWDLFLGLDAATGAQRVAPAVGEPLVPFAAPDVVLGLVTEVDRPKVLAFDVAEGEPGDHVRIELGPGTGHGARLVLTATGPSDRPAERDAAYDQWGTGAIAHVAAEATAWALARAG
jgi:uncharacterized protein YndB with AHSA1/START domain